MSTQTYARCPHGTAPTAPAAPSTDLESQPSPSELQTVSPVDLAPAPHEVLIAALEAQGWTVRPPVEGGGRDVRVDGARVLTYAIPTSPDQDSYQARIGSVLADLVRVVNRGEQARLALEAFRGSQVEDRQPLRIVADLREAMDAADKNALTRADDGRVLSGLGGTTADATTIVALNPGVFFESADTDGLMHLTERGETESDALAALTSGNPQ